MVAADRKWLSTPSYSWLFDNRLHPRQPFTIKATLARRRACRRNRRGRLRFRKPRFDNRLRKPGTLPPTVDSLRADTIRVVRILQTMYPITLIRIERNKFDPQLMMNRCKNG